MIGAEASSADVAVAVLTGVTVAIAAVSAYLAWRTAEHSAHVASGGVFMTLATEIQTPDMRAARATLLNAPRSLESWQPEHAQAAETVAQAFNTAGHLVEKHLVEQDVIIDLWGKAIVDMWAICEPFVVVRRNDEGDADVWGSFERLAASARASGVRVDERFVDR